MIIKSSYGQVSLTMIKHISITLSAIISLLYCSFFAATALAAKQKSARSIFEDKYLLLRASTSKPEQLAAFYTGRGFAQHAIDEINKTCFVTVLVKNKAYAVLWLILDDWAFYDQQGTRLHRVTRQDWKKTWHEIGLKQAHRSTFGWTQLPEIRDLRTDEHAAGNIALPWPEKPFKLVASFRTGPDQAGPRRDIVLDNLQCTK